MPPINKLTIKIDVLTSTSLLKYFEKEELMRTKVVMYTIATLLLNFVAILPVFAQENKKVTADKQVLDIFLHQDVTSTGDVSFYMWITYPDVSVKNTVPDLRVGYNIGLGAGLHISNEKANDYNGMFFVTDYKEGEDLPLHVVVWFGGDRDNDINIRLPQGYTAKVHINSIEKPEQSKN